LDELKNGIVTVCVVDEPLESVENQECIDIAVGHININSITNDSTITLQLKETEIPFGTLHVSLHSIDEFFKMIMIFIRFE